MRTDKICAIQYGTLWHRSRLIGMPFKKYLLRSSFLASRLVLSGAGNRCNNNLRTKTREIVAEVQWHPGPNFRFAEVL